VLTANIRDHERGEPGPGGLTVENSMMPCIPGDEQRYDQRHDGNTEESDRAHFTPRHFARVRSSPPQIPSEQPSIRMLEGPFSIRLPG
jgi:hypothetical protein